MSILKFVFEISNNVFFITIFETLSDPIFAQPCWNRGVDVSHLLRLLNCREKYFARFLLHQALQQLCNAF